MLTHLMPKKFKINLNHDKYVVNKWLRNGLMCYKYIYDIDNYLCHKLVLRLRSLDMK